MIGYIILAVFVLFMIGLIALYFVNSRKIKKAEVKKSKKEDVKTEEKKEKVVVPSTRTEGMPNFEAMQQAEAENRVKETVEIATHSNGKALTKTKLQKEVDLGETYIRKRMKSEITKMSSETNIIGNEGSDELFETKNKNEKSKTDKQSNNNLQGQINKLSPKMKAMLFNDILNKK